jgi:hypothetical protein
MNRAAATILKPALSPTETRSVRMDNYYNFLSGKTYETQNQAD